MARTATKKSAASKPRRVNPQVALQKAARELAAARQAWGNAVFIAQAERGGGCGGTCDGYGFGLGFDWERGECHPVAAHVFSPAAKKQAEDDLMASANASCAIFGGTSCKCQGGAIQEHKRERKQVEIISGENAGTWCVYTLWVKMVGGTCQ